MPILQDYAASSLRKAAEGADGTLDPRKVAAWQTRYGNALRAFPDLNAKFSSAADASNAIAESTAARSEAIADRNSSAIGKVMNAQSGDDVTKTVGNILGGKNSTQAMQDLVQAASRSPEATAGLRQAVADHITKNFVSNTEAGTSGTNIIRSDAYQSFLKKNRPALSQVFSPEEMNTLDRIGADLKRANRSTTSVKLPGGSNTAQDTHGIAAHNPNDTVLDRVISEAGAAGAGALVGHAAGAGLGWMGAKVANAFRASGLQKVDDLVTQAMLNPDLAQQLLRRAPAQSDSGQSIALAARLRRIGMATLATRLGSVNQSQSYKRGGRISRPFDDAGKTVPESHETLKEQQKQLIHGTRQAMLFPKGNQTELAIPNGMKRIATADGIFHYNPKKLTEAKIRSASNRGRLNDILALGPHSKHEVMARAANGEKPLVVTERTSKGTEVRAAAGTDGTLHDQMAFFEKSKTPGHLVRVEHPGAVIAARHLGSA